MPPTDPRIRIRNSLVWKVDFARFIIIIDNDIINKLLLRSTYDNVITMSMSKPYLYAALTLDIHVGQMRCEAWEPRDGDVGNRERTETFSKLRVAMAKSHKSATYPRASAAAPCRGGRHPSR